MKRSLVAEKVQASVPDRLCALEVSTQSPAAERRQVLAPELMTQCCAAAGSTSAAQMRARRVQPIRGELQALHLSLDAPWCPRVALLDVRAKVCGIFGNLEVWTGLLGLQLVEASEQKRRRRSLVEGAEEALGKMLYETALPAYVMFQNMVAEEPGVHTGRMLDGQSRRSCCAM